MKKDMLIGIFSDRNAAEAAISRLEETGYSTRDISVMMKDQGVMVNKGEADESKVGEGVVSGATTGGVIGGIAGLLIGVGALTIPGIGGILIGGPLAAALGLTGAAATTASGAVTGALAGGIVGALVGLGVPKEEAQVYEERISEGGVLVAVSGETQGLDEAREILSEEGADTIRSLNI